MARLTEAEIIVFEYEVIESLLVRIYGSDQFIQLRYGERLAKGIENSFAYLTKTGEVVVLEPGQVLKVQRIKQ